MPVLRFDFQTSHFRCHFFTRESAFNSSTILKAILNDFSEVFDGDVSTLPLPAEAPSEMPRIIISSQNKIYELQVSPDKLTITESMSKEERISSFEGIVKLCCRVLKVYLVANPGRLARLAINISRYYRDDNAAMTLANRFCRPKLLRRSDQYKGPLSRNETFEIHAHKRYNMRPDLSVNSWVRCKSGTLALTEIPDKIILVEQDINTIPEEMDLRNFSVDDAREILINMGDEANTILASYFE